MLHPKININGETAESHIKKRLDVISSIRDACEAMLELRPHGRDYLGDTVAYNDDLKAHNARFQVLFDMKTEIENEAMNIRQQANA